MSSSFWKESEETLPKPKKKPLSKGPTFIDSDFYQLKEEVFSSKPNISIEEAPKKRTIKKSKSVNAGAFLSAKNGMMEPAPMVLEPLEATPKTKKLKRGKKVRDRKKKFSKSLPLNKAAIDQNQSSKETQKSKTAEDKNKEVNLNPTKNFSKSTPLRRRNNKALRRDSMSVVAVKKSKNVQDSKMKDAKSVISNPKKGKKPLRKRKQNKIDKDLMNIVETPVYDAPPLKEVDMNSDTQKALDIITQGLKPSKDKGKQVVKVKKPLPLQTGQDTITVDQYPNVFSAKSKKQIQESKKDMNQRIENLENASSKSYRFQIDIIMPPNDTKIEENASRKYDISTLLKEIKKE